MTKVLISEVFLKCQQQMDEHVRKVVRAKYIVNVTTFTAEDPVLAQNALLPASCNSHDKCGDRRRSTIFGSS